MPGTVSVSDLALGAPVAGSDGESVGVINEVVEHPNVQMDSPASFYIEVVRGGVLGLGGEHLYIPVEAVTSIQADGTIMLSCTAREAAHHYAREPS